MNRKVLIDCALICSELWVLMYNLESFLAVWQYHLFDPMNPLLPRISDIRRAKGIIKMMQTADALAAPSRISSVNHEIREISDMAKAQMWANKFPLHLNS